MLWEAGAQSPCSLTGAGAGGPGADVGAWAFDRDRQVYQCSKGPRLLMP